MNAAAYLLAQSYYKAGNTQRHNALHSYNIVCKIQSFEDILVCTLMGIKPS